MRIFSTILFLLIVYLGYSQIPTNNLKLWINADSVSLNSGYVDTLYDLSGNNNHVAQSVLSNCPSFADSISQLNNYPVISFAGSNDFMSCDFGENFSIPNTFFIVWTKSNNSLSYAWSEIGGSHRTDLFFNNNTVGLSKTAGNDINYNQNIPFTNINTAIFNGSNSKIFRNGIFMDNGSTSDANSTSSIVLGKLDLNGCCQFDGLIAELLFYDTALTDSSRQVVEKYLMDKYAPPVNLGADINLPYGFCDTTISAEQPWFTDYSWSTGDTLPEISINQSGNYSVTVTNIFGQTSTDDIEVFYPVNTINDTTICFGDTINWHTGLDSSIYDFSWSTGDTTAGIKIYDEGFYALTLSDSLGCTYITDSVFVNIDSFPLQNVLYDSIDICDGTYMGLSEYPAGITSYLWNTGSTDSTTIITGGGNYSVQLVNNRGCLINDTSMINIIGTAPDVDFSFDTVCLGQPTHFTYLSTDVPPDTIISWNWNFGDSTFSALQNPAHTYNSPDTFIVSLEVNAHSCTNKLSKTVFVKQIPHSDFSTYGNSDQFCSNTNIQFNSNASASSGQIDNYSWDFDDGTNSTDKDPLKSFNNPGLYQIKHIVSQTNGCTDTLMKEFLIADSLPAAETPTLIYPHNGINLGVSDSVNFKWNYSNNIHYFKLLIASDSAFNNILLAKDSLLNQEIKLHLPQNHDTVFWKIQAYNSCNNLSESTTFYIDFFNPNNIGNIYLWINGDSVNSNNGYIDTCYDISGNNNHLVQNTLSCQPLSNDTISKLNNCNAVNFDGIDDNIFVEFQDTVPIPYTFFVIWNKETSEDCFLWSEKDGTHRSDLFYYNNEIGLSKTVGSSVRYNKNTPFTVLNTAVFNDQLSSIYDNGILAVSGSTVEANNVSSIVLGKLDNINSLHFNGYIAEIILYDSLLNTSDRQSVENYLMQKYAPPVNLGYDIRVPYGFCDTTISAEQPWFTDYMWSTGDTTPTITVSESGEYEVTVTDIFGLSSTDDIRVMYPEVNQPDAVSEICYGDTLQWSVDLAEADYDFSWLNAPSTGSSAEYWENTQAAVEVTDSLGCVYRSDTISVQLDMFEFTAGFGQQDTALCIGNRLTFLYGDDEAVAYEWQDGSTDMEYLIEGPGTYHATVTNGLGCVATDTVDVSILGTVPDPQFQINGHCAEANISLLDESTCPDGNITAREWLYNDSVFATGEQASISFDSAGNYDITLQLHTDVGCHNTLTQTVEVHPLPVPDFAPLTGCEGNIIPFQSLSTIEQDSLSGFYWQFTENGDWQSSTEEIIAHSYDDSGTYAVSLMAESNFECADTITQTVDIRPGPEADFSHSALCSGQPVYFNDESSSDDVNPIIRYHWNFGDGNTSSRKSPGHTFTSPGTYQMQLCVTSLNGCTDTLHNNIEVDATPQAAAGNLNACTGVLHLLTDLSTAVGDSITSWEWKLDSLVFSTSSPEITMQDTGIYPLHLSVSTNAGCSSFIDTVLSVWQTPKAQFAVERTWGDIPFTLTPENRSEGASDYYWDFDDGTTSEDITPVHTWQDSGRYEVQLVAVSDKGCPDTVRKTIRAIIPVVDVMVINMDVTLEGNYLAVEADIANAGSVPADNLAIELNTSTNNIQREYLEDQLDAGAVMRYTFRARPYVSSGLLPTYTCVSLDPGMPDDVPENNSLCVLNEAEFQLYDLYPNPTSGKLNLTLLIPDNGNIVIRVFDNAGRLVYNKDYELTKGYRQITLNCSEFTQGKYMLNISYKGKTEVRNFVLE
jgi:PKD repeat protein